MEKPVEKVLDRLEQSPNLIISDSFLPWAIRIGRRKDIPVASFWPASASLFSVFLHHDLIVSSRYYPIDLSVEGGEGIINFIPGISQIHLGDLPDVFQLDRKRILNVVIESMSVVSQAKLILFRSVKDLEETVIEAIQDKLSLPIYTIGPVIPYFNSEKEISNGYSESYYYKWLECQQE